MNCSSCGHLNLSRGEACPRCRARRLFLRVMAGNGVVLGGLAILWVVSALVAPAAPVPKPAAPVVAAAPSTPVPAAPVATPVAVAAAPAAATLTAVTKSTSPKRAVKAKPLAKKKPRTLARK